MDPQEMSPALKSKSKNKLSSNAAKEQLKNPSKPSAAGVNAGNAPAIAGSLLSGTLCTLEMGRVAASSPLINARYPHVDQWSSHSVSPPGTAAEFDLMSNNDSWSGESEDQKEKVLLPSTSTSRSEAILGCYNDKRDKIRQKNEKKHQRQKERRALELHERCTGFLMSRKLDFLTEKLVGMGFDVEVATRALMLNEGRAEDSVSWLLEGGSMDREVDSSELESKGNLKMDISNELAKITELEIEFKCSKQDVERAIVSCEGDLEKAAETLKVQKQDQAAIMQKAVKSGETIPINGTTKALPAAQTQMSRVHGKSSASVSVQQPKRDERDLNYPKVALPPLPDPRNQRVQPSIKLQSKMDLPKNIAGQNERRLPGMGSGFADSYSLASPLHAASVKAETYHTLLGNEGMTNFQSGALKEPVTVMQRPQSVNLSQNLPSTSVTVLPATTGGWNSNGVSSVDMLKAAEDIGRLNFSNVSNINSSGQLIYQTHQPQHYSWSNGRNSNGLSSLTTPSPLGLFSGWNSVSSSSSRSSVVDWSMIRGPSIPEFDYTSIDWSMDLSSSSRSGDQSFDAWSNVFRDVRMSNPSMSADGASLEPEDASICQMDPSPYIGSWEWTSPFAGKDIFRVPRQFVSPSSL